MKHLSRRHTDPRKRPTRSVAGGMLRRRAAAGILSCVAMTTGCSEPTSVVGISEPDPELVFVRGYRSADDEC